ASCLGGLEVFFLFPDITVTGNVPQEVQNQPTTVNAVEQANILQFPPASPDVTVTGNAQQEVQNQLNTVNAVEQADILQFPPASPNVTVTGNAQQKVQNQLNTVNAVEQEQAPVTQTQATQPAELSAAKETNRSSRKRKKTSSPPKQLADTALQKKWAKAKEAFQATEYDKAIALYADLLNTSLDKQARKKIEKISLKAGQEARRKAANFFQRANSATDPKVRKQHLLSSKTLLENILQKYPLAGLTAKVKRNLSRVDKELAALD
ncbi:MAG: hypothetical protein D3925_04650, partial [Candidatus Electrothrix sp. AR5]|nr:hypothetical protein [Candidatus Electrothrix sp. AR5]